MKYSKILNKSVMLLPVPSNVAKYTREVLSSMGSDDVHRVVVNDRLIMDYANKITAKHFADPDLREYTQCKIRELGRLLIILKSDYGVQSIEDALNPLNFQTLISSVKKLAGYDEETNTYRAPSVALKLGTHLRSVLWH